MNSFLKYWVQLLLFMSMNMANAQSGEVTKVVDRMKEGETVPLVLPNYTNGIESADAFLQEMDSLQDEKSRLRIVSFSSALARRSVENRGQQNAKYFDMFVTQMVSLLDEDPSGRVRSEAARGLREVVSSTLLDQHSASILRAAELYRDIDTLLLYASLPSCDKQRAADMARDVKPEGKRDAYRLNSILARCGDSAATEWLLGEASALSDISNVYLYELVDALSFVPEDRVERFLATGLHTEAYVSLPGGGSIPKRNCFALALVKMNRCNDDFPIKGEDYMFSADDLDKIEKWYGDELGVKCPFGSRKELPIIPSIEPSD
jgi:hypothetical protein